MKTLLQSIDGMIVNGNWYGALFVSLTIPDTKNTTSLIILTHDQN